MRCSSIRRCLIGLNDMFINNHIVNKLLTNSHIFITILYISDIKPYICHYNNMRCIAMYFYQTNRNRSITITQPSYKRKMLLLAIWNNSLYNRELQLPVRKVFQVNITKAAISTEYCYCISIFGDQMLVRVR